MLQPIDTQSPSHDDDSRILYSQPPSGSGHVINSSRVVPGGRDTDVWAYDGFVIPTAAAVAEVRWRGGYLEGGLYGRVLDFTITFYRSIAGGLRPLVNDPYLPEPRLAHYVVGGNAGETMAGVFDGRTLYDYGHVLESPFPTAADTKYWVRIEAMQSTYADWGMSPGTGGDGSYFRFLMGLGMFQTVPGLDLSFTLLR